MELSFKLTKGRREVALLGLLLVVAVMAFWYVPGRQETPPSAATSAAGSQRPGGAAGGPIAARPGPGLHLDRLRQPQTQESAVEADASHRNPFVFPRPKPKIDPDAPPPVPVKPRPVADYQGYLLSNGKRIAVIKMNNDVQVVPQGERLSSGYLLFKVDPEQIVLKDSDGESYSFRLPK